MRKTTLKRDFANKQTIKPTLLAFSCAFQGLRDNKTGEGCREQILSETSEGTVVI